MINLERGFRRSAWIISVISLILLVAGLVVGILYSVKQNNLANRIQYEKRSEFLKLNKANQDYVLNKLEVFEETRYIGFGMAIFGIALFTGVWIVFFLIRWIVKGFSGRD